MINTFHFSNPVDAHDRMCERFMFGDNTEPRRLDYDWNHGTEVGLHNVAIHCKTIDFDYDLKKLWIPPTRWTMMVRQYIDPTWLQDCLAKVEERMSGPRYGGRNARGIAVLRTEEHEYDPITDTELYDGANGHLNDDDIVELKTRMVQGKGTGRGVRRRWGSCMLNLSWRAQPVPTVSLHSRTTYFGYLALVDVAVARTFAKECADICRIPLENVEFVWTLDLAQFHGFRSLAWPLGQPEIRAMMDEDIPNRLNFPSRRGPGVQLGYRKALDGYARILKSDKAGTLYGDESFSSFARVRRRFHTEVFGEDYARQFAGGSKNRGGHSGFPPLPSTYVRNLDFSALNRGLGQADAYDDDDDED